MAKPVTKGEAKREQGMTLERDGATAEDPGQVETPLEGQATEATEAEPTAPQTDWQQEAQRLQSELGKIKHQFDSWQGGARKQGELEALILSQGQKWEALVEHLSNPDADPEALGKRVSSIKAQEAQELVVAKNREVANGYAADLNEALGVAGMEGNDPRLAEAAALWAEAGGAENPADMTKLFRAYKTAQGVVRSVREEKTKQEIEAAKQAGVKTRQSRNREEASLEIGSTGGLPGSLATATRANIDTLWLTFEREYPDKRNPYEAKYRQYLETGEL